MTQAKKMTPDLTHRYFTKEGADVYETVVWERRDAVIPAPTAGTPPIFEQRGVEFPASWSQNATNIVAQKYFSGQLGSNEREDSVRHMIGRVANTIADRGWDGGYFTSAAERETFRDELTYILLQQMAAFNSPVWFNIGVDGVAQQCSACFILAVDDHLSDILEWYKEEGLIFQNGSGSGINLSTLRASSEKLARGGHSSGPVTFMRGADASAGTITSGGRCLAPWQQVYTESGPVQVKDLAEKDFIAISYDPPAGRYKAKKAQAWKSGYKEVLEITTDKGKFHLSADHPVRLSDHRIVRAGDLVQGNSLFACTINITDDGYLRVNLKDGKKGKKKLHLLVAQDALGFDLEGMAVHHKDGDKLNNTPGNLQVFTQAEHAKIHSDELVARGEHVFQNKKFPKNGAESPIHHEGAFWKSEEKVSAYKEKQRRIFKSDVERAREMQKDTAQQKMLNTAFAILNQGYSIDTFEDYVHGRKAVIGQISSIKQLESKISDQFGSYDTFVKEVAFNNHRVVSIKSMGTMDVYDVEVECPTPDDKSSESGHNFVIWSDDSLTGSGIVVSNTRRAAKMVILDVDHPDIEEFIWCKAKEEEKARALAEAGFDMSLNTEEGAKNWASLQYQNANNSVRLSDEFLQACEEDREWNLIARTTGEVMKTLRARGLMRQIADAAWQSADPGVQYDTTINEWHTTPSLGRITASNPCSEYLSNDDTSCNLASLNLMKFLKKDGTFDVEMFRHAVRVVFTAQEILISFADYPTEKIGERTAMLRQIGIGYTNLGALLMASGLPYDSDEGREYAATITALMTGESYAQSGRLAERVGPFATWGDDRESMIRVLKMHKAAAKKLNREGSQGALARAAQKSWNDAVKFSENTGVRNAQASVLAPTGTISFLMDSDTTGIEPDFSLVKHKKLVGGGTMQIVNQTVPMALRKLGYTDNEVREIMEYIMEQNHAEGAPHIKAEHVAIFDTAVGTVGGRAIHYMGHLQMMAACQPFLSGSISKTVNLPQEATIEDIYETYMEGWRQGLKAVAIYRDGTKVAQPLGSKDKDTPEDGDLGEKMYWSERRLVPREPVSMSHKFRIAGHSGYFHVDLFEDGQPGAIFINISKAGSQLRGWTDVFSVSASMCLQYGMPVQEFVEKFAQTSFDPHGFTDHKQIRTASSIMDYLAKWLAIKFLPTETWDQLGIHGTPEVDESEVIASDKPGPIVVAAKTAPKSDPAKPVRLKLQAAGTGVCDACGGMTVQTGKCQTCTQCGKTGGCG